MCDTMEVSYEDGDIVWVKLGPCWWPGEVWALDKLPSEMTKSFRKTPIAVVKFFEEDSFEYVKNANLIFKYNCSRKNEFIKKGMDLNRGKLSHMEKFPLDVVRAEKLTHGDEDILQSSEFMPVEVRKTSYAGIFGTPAKTTPPNTPLKKGRLSGSAKRKSDLSPGSHQKITHPRILQKFLKGTSDYKAHILVQEPKRVETPVTPDTLKRSPPESDTSPNLGEPSPRTPPGNSTPAPGTYACHACNFTATRLNVMILHNKSHSAGFVPYTPPKKHKIKTSPLKLKTVKLESTPGRSSAEMTDKKPRKKPKNITESFPTDELSTDTVPHPTKRKGGKIKDKEVKKPKTDIEIKNSLLADWSEDSDESMDILSSLKLTENQTADEEKPEDGLDNIGEDDSIEKDEPGESETVPAKITDEVGPRKYASCFDFEDDDDAEMPIESLGRKIPRLPGKVDDIKKSVDSEDISDRLAGKETDGVEEDPKQGENCDLDAEIDNLLQETAVPELPSLPGDLKLAENFQKGKAIKFPDKEKDSAERLPIFKTKTFFRSRHSRSQDAIEKYVADNIGADKRPTYMEDASVPTTATDNFTCESDSEPIAVLKAETVTEEKAVITDVKTAKLTPKIMLKKMKIIIAHKKETVSPLPVKEIASPTTIGTEDTCLKSPVKSTISNIEDKWSNENLDKLLETDSFVDEKKIESYGTTEDLLGTIEEVPAGIFHIADNASNHVDSSPKKVKKNDSNFEDSVDTLKKTATHAIEDKQQPQIKTDKVPTESDLQIAEALINLPAMAGPPPNLLPAEKSSPSILSETPVQKDTMEFNESDPSLNAAESLVQMSEAFASDPVQIHAPNAFTGVANDPEPDTVVTNISSEPSGQDTLKTSNSQLSTLTPDHIEDAPAINSSILVTPKAEENSKIVMSRIVSPKGREKILNFNTSAGLPPKDQKQKVIIRRTAVPKIQRSGGDRFGDTSHEKLVLSNKTVAGRDGDVQTFTIETPTSDHVESSTMGQIDKVKKFFPGKQKLIIKPRGAVITSTGKIVQTTESKDIKKDEDVLFDINSMPIVLSEEILTPEVLGTAVTSQETTAVKIPEVIPEVKKVEPEKVTKILSAMKKYNADSPISKPSNFMLKPVMEKSASPNILSKSKIKSYKNLILMDKQAGVVEQKFPKQEDVKEAVSGKIIKTGTIAQPLKTEKYIIVPSSGGKMMSGERTQKIIMNPQTGKGQLVLGRVNDSTQAENFPTSKPQQKTVAKIIQNRSSNPQTSGNAIMILTNAQGVQSKLVLTSEHQRLLFSKKSIQTTAITPQSVVTSKGTILSPIATNNRNKNINVSSHSIISPRGQIINSAVGNAVISGTGQLVPSRLLTKKGPPTPQKLIMTSNPNTRTILTGRPGQTILTSKGQLITQSSIVTSQSKISNIVKTTTVLSQPGRQLKLLKTSPPGKPQVIKTKQGPISHEKLATGEPTTLLLQSSPGKGQTIIRAPGERPLIIPQRGGVLQLTVAQFEHMQKTGRLVHKSVVQKSALPSRATADVSTKGQNPKFIIQKYTNSKRTAEQAGVKQKAVNVYSGSVPPLALIQSESPVKRQKLRELLTVKPDTEKSGMRGMQTSRSSESKVLIEQTKGRSATVPQPIAPAVSSNRKTEVESYLKTDRPENIQAAETITPISEVSEGTAPPPTESQLLAVPGENFGGPPDSFFLCVEENGTLTPVNNQPLVLENNQLVPMVIEPPPPPRLRIEDSAISLPLPSALPGEPAEGQTPGIILNTGDQQILLDRPTLLGLLSGEGQQLVTADGQRLILQGDVQQLISAIAANPEIAGLLSGGQQILLDAGDATQSLVAPPDPGNSSSSIGSEFLFPRGNQVSANQDILAAALAGTDVFQQEPLISDSLNIVTGGHNSALGEIDSLSPDFQNLNASVSVHSHVSETSSTLNQPIMSPLEVPTKRRTGKQMDAERGGNLLSSKNLEDSLAGIGVTAPSVPTSLDLPITVTDPRIAPKVSINPLSLSCGVVYQSSSMLSNSMLSPGVRMSDADSSQSRLDYTYDSYGLSNQTDKVSTALNEEREYIHKKSSSKLGSDPVLSSHQTERSKRETKVAPSMPVLSSSMPRLDDSSSDGFVDDHSRPLIETVPSKTYSPISMPLLTEDAVDELPAENSSIETSADTPRDDTADPYISTGENFVFSETKSMPVLMEPEPTVDTDIIMKDGDISSDRIENVETTHLDRNEFDQTEPYTHQESNEISVPDDDPVNESKVDEVKTFEPVLIQSSMDHAETHDTPENSNLQVQSLLSAQDIQEPVSELNTPLVTEASNFLEDEIPKVTDNYPEDVHVSEDVNLHPCDLSGCVTEVASHPEDLHVSDTCIVNIEQSPVVENVPVHDITDTETIALTEETFAEETESNVVESLSSQVVNEDDQIESQRMVQSPRSNDVMECNLESEKILSPSHDINNIIEPDSCLESTNNDAIDQINLETHVTEPENNIGSNYIADPETQDTDVESGISKDCQDYNYDPEDHLLAPQNNIAEALSKMEAENNVTESALVEPMEISPDELNTEESGVIVECEKQNEDFQMTDDIVNETEHALPVISDNGGEMNEYHEQPVENDETMVTLNNDDHNIQLDNDVIEPSSVPSETCDSPGRPLTPYPLIHTPNDEINLPSADSDPPMDRLHVSCDPDRVPAEAALSPNLNSTPSPELTQNYTDSSSNDSVEIPIQPSISVSQRAVQMCTDDRPNDDGKKSPENTVQTSGNSFTFDDER